MLFCLRSDNVAGLSPGRFGILVLIDTNPGLIAGRGGEDRRTNELWLTRSGRNFLATAMRHVQAHERRFAARRTAKERRELVALHAKRDA